MADKFSAGRVYPLENRFINRTYCPCSPIRQEERVLLHYRSANAAISPASSRNTPLLESSWTLAPFSRN